MNRRNRAGRRAAVALAAVLAPLEVAAPAEAHPAVSGPHCDAGNGRFICTIGTTGSVPPVDIRWYIDGRHALEFDDRRSAHGSCPIGSYVGVEAVVTDATGVPVPKSRTVPCREDTP
jgi:hypothetical protein